MKGFRISIAKSMALISGCAVGVAAVRSPTILWLSTITTLTLFILAVAIPATLILNGSNRAFWIGVATLGWGYWLVAVSPWFSDRVSPLLITTPALEGLYARFGRDEGDIESATRTLFLRHPDAIKLASLIDAIKIKAARALEGNPKNPMRIRLDQGLKEANADYDSLWAAMYPRLRKQAYLTPIVNPDAETRFVQIGHNILALAVAVLGGIIRLYFYQARDPNRSTSNTFGSERPPSVQSQFVTDDSANPVD